MEIALGTQNTSHIGFDEKVKYLQRTLLKWYEIHGRKSLPWRRNDISPFHKLVAEILLQKTRAENIVPIYLEFIKRYPSAIELAKESEEKLAEFLKPLGLYRNRARNLIKMAKIIVDRGIPRDRRELELLPGVGPYIANAFLVTAYNYCLPVVDTNVRRFLSRVFSLRTKRDVRRDPFVWKFMERILPSQKCREFIWAVLDFSAKICKPKPRCNVCPIKDICNFFTKQ